MIISFSGLDGAGKTTQIQTLLQAYQDMGDKTDSTYSYFPDLRYYKTDELKDAYSKLRNSDVIHMRYRLNSNRNNAIMQSLEEKGPKQPFLSIIAAIQGYLDHRKLYKYILFPLLNNNKTLIFDRYYYDELAFKYIYGCPNFILKKIYNNAIKSDIGFYINISSYECLQRNISRPDSKIALYQSKTLIDSLIDRFNLIAKKNRLIILDGTKSKEEIAQTVLNYLTPKN